MKQVLRREAVKRNVRFWGTIAEKMMLLIIGFTVMYGILFGAGLQESLLETFIDRVPYYSIFLGAVMLMVSQFSYGPQYIPLALSFGAKRSETVWGVQFMNLLLILQILLLTYLGLVLRDGFGNQSGQVFLLFALLLITVTALGQLCGAAILRLGTKAAFILILMTVIMGGAIGAAVGIMSFQDVTSGGNIWLSLNLSAHGWNGISRIVLLIGGIGVLLYVVSVLALRKTVRHYEVRR